MNVASDMLLLPIATPQSGAGSADPAAPAEPGAFERELEGIPEPGCEDGSARLPEDVPEEAIPLAVLEEVIPPMTPASPEGPPEGEITETGVESPRAVELESLATLETPALETPVETTLIVAPETVRKSEGFAGAPEPGAVSGDTPPSSSTFIEPAEVGEVHEVPPEPTAEDLVLPLETDPTRPAGPVTPHTSIAKPTPPVEPESLPALGAALPTPPADAPAAPDAPRPSTLPSGVTAPLTYEAVAAPIRVLAREGGGEARIQLTPPDLGRVDVTVVVEDGHVRAALVPERPEVAELLVRHIAELQDRLAELGLGVEDLDVQTGGPRDEGHDPWREEADQVTGTVAGSSLEEPLVESNISDVHIGPDGVDVWA